MPTITKKELRQRLRQSIDSISAEALHSRSVQACHHLMSSPEYARAEVVMVFLSLPNEVDTTSLVLHAWRDRKRVLAPKVSWEQRRMLPLEIRSLSENVSQSPLGIREPAQGMPIPVSLIDLVVVPGLGFDLQGNRIGRGRGFYDRFLAHPDWHGVACGLALEEQVVHSVPVSDHDMQVDMLVTDTAVRRFGA
ncbi:MAG: 5-formyltetrahydrofolate cyclo-ligase [Phycisphaerae bacterium]|jgi:5-formyltetrahydrofolate cyclo-ligase